MGAVALTSNVSLLARIRCEGTVAKYIQKRTPPNLLQPNQPPKTTLSVQTLTPTSPAEVSMLACIGYIVPEFVRFPGGVGGVLTRS